MIEDRTESFDSVAYEDAICGKMTSLTHNKVQLWDGGPYWAETNIGAEYPWEFGYYFWWGDTVGYYKHKNSAWIASDSSALHFWFERMNTPTYGKSLPNLQSERWITVDNVLMPDHDAARVQWGGGWRIPTRQELSDLRNKCEWIWTRINGVNGCVIRGKGDYASASIFLPAAGYGYCGSLYDAGSYGRYWSSVPFSGYNYSWYLYFFSSFPVTSHYDFYRFFGQSVRPVQGFTK